MLVALLAVSTLWTQTPSYLINGGLDGARGWQVPQNATFIDRTPGNRCLSLTSGVATQIVLRRASWRRMTAAVDIRVQSVTADQPGGFAYASIYQYSDQGAIVAFRDFIQLTKPADWKRYTYTFDLTPATSTLYFHIGFYHAHGKADFDGATLVEGSKAMGIDQVQGWGGSGVVSKGVLVWSEKDLPVPAGGADPAWVVKALKSAGLDARSEDLAGLERDLTPDKAGTLVLSYGEAYPLALRSQLVAFCRAGGRLVVIGGYPVNAPLRREGGKWVNWAKAWQKVRDKAVAWPNNLLPDGGFEHAQQAPVGGQALDGQWRRDDSKHCFLESTDTVEGKEAATVKLGHNETNPGEVKWFTWLPVKPGHEYEFRAQIKSRDVQGKSFGYVAVYQYDGEKLVTPHDLCNLRGDTPWHEVSYSFLTDYAVNRVFIKFGLYQSTGQVWLDKAQLVDVTGMKYRPLNTSSGLPRDGLILAPNQMGMCDADFPLKRVAYIEPSAGQSLIGGGRMKDAATGWAASGVTGGDAARWVPLLDARDRYGRLRGAAGALLLNYGGFYSGSLWAYFGVENKPLFGPSVGGSGDRLASLVKWMQRGCFLHNLKAVEAMYEPGETAQIAAQVSNFGYQPFHGVLELRALCDGKQVGSAKGPIDTGVNEPDSTMLNLKLSAAARGLVVVRARLLENNKVVDQAVTGFVVYDTKDFAAGPTLLWKNNYFTEDGRPLFLFGSDTYANDYQAADMNPTRWDEIQREARDYGLQVYENLQYSNPGHLMTDSDWRNFEGMADLLMRNKLAFMCGLLIGHNVAVDNQELAAEGDQVQGYAEHLGKVPGMLWYINGDFQLQYNDKAWLKTAWNAWLKNRYGSDAALAKAWRVAKLPAPIGQLDFPPHTTGAWNDPVEVSRTDFNVWLMRRWIEYHVQQIRSEDKIHAITSEYYSEPFGGIDLRLTLDGQNVSNFGFFSTPHHDLVVLPERIAMNDMRYLGKGVDIGEYGVKTHPAWSVANGASNYHIRRTPEQEKQLFMTIASYALGMGVSKIQNWCLRDADGSVFPWGLFYPGRQVPKDIAYVHRNLSLMWRLLAPAYSAPSTTILAPTPLRTGNTIAAGRQAIYMATQGLLRLHLPFNVADDFNADKLPAATTTLVWPAAIAASDDNFQAVVNWVKAGGQLIVSGYPGWDERFAPVAADRLKELTGCTAGKVLFQGVSRSDGLAATATVAGEQVTLRPQVVAQPGADSRVILKGTLAGAGGDVPLIVKHQLGAGTVVWLADPMEVAPRDDALKLTSVYSEAMAALPSAPKPIKVEAGSAAESHRLHVMRQRTASGNVWVVYGADDDAPTQVTLSTPAGDVRLKVRPWWPAMVMVTDDGRVLMVVADGKCSIDGKPLLAGGPMVGLASLDGQDLRKSAAVILCPYGLGDVHLAGLPTSGEWGESENGKWTRLDGAQIRDGVLSMSDDQSTLVALLCRGDAGPWRQHLSQLFTEPWQVKGY